MGVVSNYVFSAMSDSALPHMREPVEDVFNEVVENKGLPTRQDFRDLRNRVDMLEYNAREVTKLLHEVRGLVSRTRESTAAARASMEQ
jgi:hypothetical protein